MIDRLRALLADHAAALAVHDGVPVAVRHIHAAAHQVAALIDEARNWCIRDLTSPPRPAPAAAVPVAEPDPKPEPEPQPTAEPAATQSPQPEKATS